MNNRFGRPHGTLGRASDRDRKLFIAAAILAMSLVLVLAVVFKFKIANGSEDKLPRVTNSNAGSVDMATITLLAPERPVKAGSRLADVRFKKMFWPRNQVPEGAIQDVAEIRGKFAKVDLAAGSPIEARHLTDRPALSVLPVTRGNRAVTINVDAETAIEYHVVPGTNVDVVLTHYIGRDVRTKVIVQKARVLSLGGSTENKVGAGQRTMRSKTVTLDVSPKDALDIITARGLGRLSLLLRDQTDDAPMPVDERDRNTVIDDKRGKGSAMRKRCTKGRVKIDGSEFIVDCDGGMFRANDGFEP